MEKCLQLQSYVCGDNVQVILLVIQLKFHQHYYITNNTAHHKPIH